MGNSEGNTVIESDRMPGQSSSTWKVIDESNSIYPDEGRRPIMYPNFTNGDSKPTSKICTTIRGNVISFRADTYSKPNATGKEVVPVDLRMEKTDSEKSDPEKRRENEKTQNNGPKGNATPKLKFGIDNILAQSSTSNNPSKDSASDSFPFGKACDKNKEMFAKKSPFRYSSKEDSDRNDGRQTNRDRHQAKKFSGFFGEQCQQHLLNYQQKMPVGQGRKCSRPIQYHPYRLKDESNVSRSFLDATSNFAALKHHDDRYRRRSESPNQKMLLERSFGRISKSPVARINTHSSGEKMRSLRQSSDPNPGKFRPLSPIYKSTAAISLEPRSKSLNSSPFDSCAKTATQEKSSSPRSNGSPFFESFKGTISDHINQGIRKRINSESDEVFNDDGNHKSLRFRHDGATVWKQRHFSAQEEHNSVTTSPEFLHNLEQRKQGATSFFPVMGGHSTPPFTPPLIPPNFNLQSWQQAMASNCHPSFRHLVFPYAFGHSAAVAMATAMRQSFKSLTSPGMMISDSLQGQKSPNKSGFNIQDTRSNQHSFSDKASSGPRKRRKWSRAVFSIMQRRGLEKSFQAQKYVAKPERRGLAEALGLTDAQVKIWFQNRRMKWRQEQKNSNKLNVDSEDLSPTSGEEHFNQINLQ